MAYYQRLVHKTVAVPALLGVVGLWQRNCPTHEAAESVGLGQCLPVELVNPLRRTVGRDDDNTLMLIVSFSDGRRQIEQGCTTGDADDDGLVKSLRHTQSIETGTTLIRHRVARDVRALVQVVNDR